MNRLMWCGAVALALAAGNSAQAYFPPDVDQIAPLPPDPFTLGGVGGLGQPEPPDPGPGPAVATPEPATALSALIGLALAAGLGWRNRLSARRASEGASPARL